MHNDPWAARVRGASAAPRALPKRMTRRSILTALVLCGLGPWASGCAAARVPRPQPGDRVVPQILLGEHPWRAGGAITLSVCLRVGRPGEAETGLLQMEEVPEGSAPIITLTFWKDRQRVGEVTDVRPVRDC